MEQTKKRRARRPWIEIILLLIVGYPLSIGPFMWLALSTGVVGSRFFDVVSLVYLPLIWGVGHSPAPFQESFQQYLSWWTNL